MSKTKSSLFLMAVIVVALGGLTAVIVHDFRGKNDKQRFEKLDARLASLENSANDKIGEVSNREANKICYYAEQGPYNHGRLWCSVSRTYAISLLSTSSAKAVVTTLDGLMNEQFGTSNRSSLSKNIVTKNDTVSDNAIFMLPDNVRCDFDAAYPKLGTSSASSKSGQALPSIVQVTSACSSPAAQAHYPLQ